jgi:hypothetical protein
MIPLRTLATSAAAGLLVLAAATSALAASGTLDQQHACAGDVCNDESTAYPDVNAPVAPGATQAVTLAQTFTPGVSGQLTDVGLFLAVLGGQGVVYPASLEVRIVEVDGSGHPDMSASPLASTNVPIASLPAPGTTGWVEIAFTSPATLVAGTTYAIALGPSPLASTPWMIWQMDVSSKGAYVDYPGGEAMGASLPNAGSWTWNLMYDWVAQSGTGTADFGFRTYMVEAAPTPSPSPSISPSPSPTPSPSPSISPSPSPLTSPSPSATSAVAPTGSAPALTPPPTATVDQPTTDPAGPFGMVVALLAGIVIGGLVIGLARPKPARGRR